ncbi:MAG: hypothetical protein HRU41_08405 [Saprospiraceae bacterium]|nr:hypothetical protein [Saprospiraceae bacterium]
MKSKLLFLCLALLTLSCTSETPATENSTPQDPLAHITDGEVKRVLTAAMDKAGGLDRWNKLASLQFTKDYSLLLESGEVENAAFQQHLYTFGTNPTVDIRWEKEGKTNAIHFKEGQYQKLLNDAPDTSMAQQSVINTVLSATFVVSIPFKLLDEGVQLSYSGLDTLANGKVVEVLQASYDPEEHAEHSTPDIWKHYYDAEDFTFLAYMVQHADHYSYVENQSFHEVEGFLLPKTRKSYRVDEDRNLLYLRADYAYDDYSLEWSTAD